MGANFLYCVMHERLGLNVMRPVFSPIDVPLPKVHYYRACVRYVLGVRSRPIPRMLLHVEHIDCVRKYTNFQC